MINYYSIINVAASHYVMFSVTFPLTLSPGQLPLLPYHLL